MCITDIFNILFGEIRMRPLISVIVPVYNVGKYLKESIESIQRQTYENLQIILVDDGSTDDSGDICDFYAERDSRIEVIHQENQGITYTRKVGLKKAKGTYIGFVDGDDTIDECMYEFLCKKLEESDADFIHSGYYENNREIIPFKDGVMELYESKGKFLCTSVLGETAYLTPSIWSKLFRADFIRNCFSKVPDKISYGEDFISLCVCVLEAKRFVLLAKAYYHYRIRNDSLTRRDFVCMSRDYVQLYEALCDLARMYNNFGDLEYALKKFLFYNLLAVVQREIRDVFPIATYRFVDLEKIMNKEIILYGAGVVGKSLFTQISRYKSCRIVAWVDKKTPPPPDEDIVIESPSVLKERKYDLILLAVRDEKIAAEIKKELCDKGVDEQKVLWSMPEKLI